MNSKFKNDFIEIFYSHDKKFMKFQFLMLGISAGKIGMNFYAKF